ncbi:hypothetical protein MMC16_001120 [Acarospora aff. strigata]|nr:hypothetical protein [Acarospora aff. strigata]
MGRSVLFRAEPGSSRPSGSSGSEGVEQPRAITSSQRSLSLDRKGPRAILYDPSKQELSTLSITILEQTSNIIQVHLPPWRNRVDIYLDEKAREKFVATVNLNRLGPAKNWQRRLRRNYTSLYVKGAKPEEMSRTSPV